MAEIGKGKSDSLCASIFVLKSKRTGLRFFYGEISRILRIGRYNKRLET